MKRLEIFLGLIVVILLTISKVASAQDAKIALEVQYWMPELTARGKVVVNNTGTDIDFKRDLAIEDENLPGGNLVWYTGPNSRIRLGYTQISYSGDKHVEQTIEYGGKIYTFGTRVVTDLEVRYIRLGWIWQFVNIAERKVKFGSLLEVKGFWVDTSLKAPDFNIAASKEFTMGLPTIGVALDINIHRIVNLFAEASGLPAGEYGYLIDADAGIRIIPQKNICIVGGYRSFDIKVKDDPNYAKLKISGPFVGITLRF
jgi:hypothetical protein